MLLLVIIIWRCSAAVVRTGEWTAVGRYSDGGGVFWGGGGPPEPHFQPVDVHVVVSSGYLVVARRVHFAPAESDEVRVPAAKPDEVRVDAASDGRARVPTLHHRRRPTGRPRPTVKRPSEPHEVLVHCAASGQRVYGPYDKPLVHGAGGRGVDPVSRQRCQCQRHRQQAQ